MAKRKGISRLGTPEIIPNEKLANEALKILYGRNLSYLDELVNYSVSDLISWGIPQKVIKKIEKYLGKNKLKLNDESRPYWDGANLRNYEDKIKVNGNSIFILETEIKIRYGMNFSLKGLESLFRLHSRGFSDKEILKESELHNDYSSVSRHLRKCGVRRNLENKKSPNSEKPDKLKNYGTIKTESVEVSNKKMVGMKRDKKQNLQEELKGNKFEDPKEYVFPPYDSKKLEEEYKREYGKLEDDLIDEEHGFCEEELIDEKEPTLEELEKIEKELGIDDRNNFNYQRELSVQELNELKRMGVSIEDVI